MKTTADRIVQSLKKHYWIYFVLVLAFAAFNLFFRLDALPVQDWDEGRNGVSAYEMFISGDYSKHTFLDQTDYSNTKPPLLYWCMALSYRVFGTTLFAFRFPSALFGWLTVLLVMIAARRFYNERTSLFAGVILSTSYAFIHYHAARKGEFDSLLVFLVTSALVLILESDRKKYFLYLSALVTGLVFLTKSFAVMQVFAVVVMYFWLTGRYKKLDWKDYLLYLGLFLVPVLAWGLLRYQADGLAFFRSMIANDLVERTYRNIQSVPVPTLSIYYFGILLAHFFPWSLFLVLAVFYRNRFRSDSGGKGTVLRLELNRSFRNPLFAFWAVVPFVLFSLATNKLAWYINAIYPPLAVLTGWFVANASRTGGEKGKYFLGGKRILLTFAAFVLLYEIVFLTVIPMQDRTSSQRFLSEMKSDGGDKFTIYFVGRYENNGERFLARVVKHYKIRLAGSVGEFFTDAVPGDLLYMEDNPRSERIAREGKLKIVERNGVFLTAGK